MAIPIDENVFLFFLGAVFIPIVTFMIKLIIDIGVIKSKLENVIQIEKENSKELEGMNRHDNRLNLVESRVDRLERQEAASAAEESRRRGTHQ